MGLRRIFEENNNQKELDKLVIHYIDEEILPHEESIEESKYSFLQGVRLTEKTINDCNQKTLYILIINRAEPQNLLSRALLRQNTEYALSLYKKGFIDIAQLQRYVAEYGGKKFILYILDNLKEFEGIDLKIIKEAFFRRTYIAPLESILHTALRLSAIFPDINDISWYAPFFESASQGNLDMRKEFIGFFGYIFLGLTLGERINLLYDNPFYEKMFAKSTLFTPVKRKLLGYEEEARYLAEVEKLTSTIIEGDYPHIILAMEYLPELYEKRFEILNAWIEKNKVLELDIYANTFIEGKLAHKKDKEYKNALQKREEEKKHRIQPVNPDKKD